MDNPIPVRHRGLYVSPVVFFAVAFSIGIIFGRAYSDGVSFQFILVWAIIFLALSALKYSKPIFFNTYLFMEVILLGWLAFINSKPHSPGHIVNLARDKSRPIALEGVVASDPICTERQTIFVLRTTRLANGHPISGCVQVRSYKQARSIQYGDEVIIQGALYKPPRLSEFDYRGYLARKNIYALLAVKKTGRLEILEKGRGNRLIAGALRLRRRISDILSRHISGEPENFLKSILIGEYETMSKDTKDIFRRTGTLHIIAISGLNVGLVASIFMASFKPLFVSRNARYGVIIPILFIYAAMCGAQASVVRATIMASIVALGFILGRDVDIYNSVALAALALLFYNPNYLFNVGFQLSFVAVLALLYLPKRMAVLLHLKPQFGLRRSVVNSIFASVSAGVATAPIIAFNFHIFTPIMVIANLIAVPFAFFITVCGFLIIIAHPILPLLANYIGGLTADLVGILLFSLRFLSRLPLSSFSF